MFISACLCDHNSVAYSSSLRCDCGRECYLACNNGAASTDVRAPTRGNIVLIIKTPCSLIKGWLRGLRTGE